MRVTARACFALREEVEEEEEEDDSPTTVALQGGTVTG